MASVGFQMGQKYAPFVDERLLLEEAASFDVLYFSVMITLFSIFFVNFGFFFAL